MDHNRTAIFEELTKLEEEIKELQQNILFFNIFNFEGLLEVLFQIFDFMD